LGLRNSLSASLNCARFCLIGIEFRHL